MSVAAIWFLGAVMGTYVAVLFAVVLDLDNVANLVLFGLPAIGALFIGVTLRQRFLGAVAGGLTASLGVAAGYAALITYSAFKTYNEPVVGDGPEGVAAIVLTLILLSPIFVAGVLTWLLGS